MATLERRRSAVERYPSLYLRTPTRPSLEFWGWGRNDFGQLGVHDEQHYPLPVQLAELDAKNVVHFSGASFNSAFLTDDGEVYMTGLNDNGQLAMKSTKTRLQPTQLSALDAYRITHLAVGVSHTLAITEQGALLAWGSNDEGQLGSMEQRNHYIPRLHEALKDLHFVRVACGSAHSLALTSTGTVYSCGQGNFGALGHGDFQQSPTFRQIQTLFGYGIVQIECGEFHSVALSISGKVWTWGRGRYGQLGLGHIENTSRPTLVSAFSEENVTHVACGDDHTLCVTKDGIVYAWGQSKWGQTGTGFTQDILLPMKLERLKEEYITQVAAGSRHSVVLAMSQVIFVFGNHELHQLGLKIDSNFSSIPLPIPNLPSYPVIAILAKGDHNVVMFDKSSTSEVGITTGRYGMGMMPSKIPNLRSLLDSLRVQYKSQDPNENLTTLQQVLDDMFECPEFLINAFRAQNQNGAAHGLDIEFINFSHEKIFTVYDGKIVLRISLSCSKMLETFFEILSSSSSLPRQNDEYINFWLPALMIMMLNPALGESFGARKSIVSSLASILLYLSQNHIRQLEQFLKDVPVEYFGGRMVYGVQKYLSHLARNHSAVTNPIMYETRQEILIVCRLLDLFYKVNLEIGEIVAFERFYNTEVSDGVDLANEYLRWTSVDDTSGRSLIASSFYEFPFILTPEAKVRITRGEALIKKERIVQTSQIGAFFRGIDPNLVAFLDIRIQRERLREDAISQLSTRVEDFQKPLRVTFVTNGVEEEGQDQGGLTKEFFQLLIEEIFNEDFGMFVYQEETRNFWFSPSAFEMDDFILVGWILGLAIYNNVILDVHLPLVAYKKLMGYNPNFHDLLEAFPSLAKGLQQLLEFDGDVENTFLRLFEVEYECFGEHQTKELKSGGASIPVTSANRQEYVDLYTNYVLDESIKDQFEHFSKGFWKVCAGQTLSLFRYEELELLVCGLPHLDFHDLEKVTQYDGGYTPAYQVIQDFWSVLHELSLKEKKKFLFFATGCDRAPVGGLSKLKLIIQRSGPDTDRLPTSHTCFNILLLPEYGSRDKLRERLILAIHNAQGFGLQ